jgi:hypothetical protein
MIVRKAVAVLGVVLGACSVDTDSTNEQVTLEYNKTEMRKAAPVAPHGKSHRV